MNDNKSFLPTIFVIFGATGDLARRKIIPALFALWENKLTPEMFQIVAFSRRELTDDLWREQVIDILGKKAESDKFANIFTYRQGFFDKQNGFKNLSDFLGYKDNEWRVCSNKLFYLAVPPQYYKKIFNNLAASHLTDPCSPEEGWTRVIVEKPFGKDYKTAEDLDILLGRLFKEEQIYRIDHYLGKETVQNILAFRFSNSFLGPAWNKNYVESIDIKIHERGGIETRGDFYDATGALRDVGQNHLLQLLALFTMDNPKSFDGPAVRKERAEILKSLDILKSKEVDKFGFRAQYRGYSNEKGVRVDSKTETYFKIKVFLNDLNWNGVPIYLEHGKRLKETKAEVVVTFKHDTPCLCPLGKHYKNVLRYEIQPHEGVRMSFWVKRPGVEMVIEEKDFSFSYKTAYRGEEHLDPHVAPYQKLLLDAFAGNQTLFVSTDEIKASWKFIDPIAKHWRNSKEQIHIYKPKSDEVFKKSSEIV
jgi:glucose-6-phosphate 1-dehydrogenase